MFGEIHWMTDGGLHMWLFWVLLPLFILLLFYLVGRTSDRSSGSGKTALEILEERYARGEIEQTEFEQKKKDLMRD